MESYISSDTIISLSIILIQKSVFTCAQVTNPYLRLSNLTVSDLQMLKTMYEPINLAIKKKKKLK